MEGQAQYIEDFVIKYQDDYLLGSFSPYTVNMATVLNNSGINSNAVNSVLNTQQEKN